jgi:hypothetical protein
MNSPLIQTNIEADILRICDTLEDLTVQLSQVSGERAEAEAEYRYRYARALVEQTAKVPVATKEAVAHLKATNSFRDWKILEAREKTTQQALFTHRSRLDALRTISANVRASGG